MLVASPSVESSGDCPTIAFHEAGNKGEQDILSKEEQMNLLVDYKLFPVGSFTLQDLVELFEEAKLAVKDREPYDIIDNNCASPIDETM